MEDLTQIDDNAVVFKREGTYQARIRVDGKYVYRSLKTGDLAVAIAIASSLKEKSVEEGSGFIGEVSLAGELRPVSQIEKRVQEFRFSGFKRIYVSEGDVEKARGAGFDGEIIGARTVSQVLGLVF